MKNYSFHLTKFSRKFITFFLTLLWVLMAKGNSQPPADCQHSRTSFNCVKYIRNYDGDTITFEIPGVHPLLGNKISVRLKGIDTPEIRTKNTCEKKIGRTAKRLVENLLKGAQRIDLKNIKRGKYFRIVADVYVDKVLLSDVLLKNRLAASYDGGRKPRIDWCQDKGKPVHAEKSF